MSEAEELERKYAVLFPHFNGRQQHLIAAFDAQQETAALDAVEITT